MSMLVPPTGQWSDIAETPIYLEKLRLLCHSQKELKSSGYIVAPLLLTQLQSKSRCEDCGVRRKHRPQQRIRNEPHTNTSRDQASEVSHEETLLHVDERTTSVSPSNPGRGAIVCMSHAGKVVNKRFSCCWLHASAVGCVLKERHTFQDVSAVPFQRYWEYHKTPSSQVPRAVTDRPRKSLTRAHREFYGNSRPVPAIALDCEMGTAASNENELIRLTAVNYFTKEILIDKLVQPSVPMKHFNTKYSGITAADMRNAVRRRECFVGRDAARDQLWKFVGPETIVMVHGGNNDLSALRWIHPVVIDSFILDGYGPKTEGGRSLKNLCSRVLQMTVQVGKGHDSYEDAVACRELVHSCVRWIPD